MVRSGYWLHKGLNKCFFGIFSSLCQVRPFQGCSDWQKINEYWFWPVRQKFPEIPLFLDFRTLCPAMQSNQNISESLQPETFFVFVQIALSESADLCFDLFRCSLGGLCVDMVHWVSWKKPLWVINFAPNWHTHSLEMKSETSKKRKHSKIWHDNLSGDPHSLLYYR